MESPSHVVVGQKYMVPCMLLNNGIWLPILFPAHEDGSDFCFNKVAKHYHIDRRFSNDELGFSAWLSHTSEVIELKEKVCIKQFAKSYDTQRDGNPVWPFAIVKMHETFQDYELKGRTCPHKGLKITNDCGTCPGHGLVWNLETKKLKYKLPFSLVNKEFELSGVINDNWCDIRVTTNQKLPNPLPFVLVDADGAEYPEARIEANLAGLKYGDTLTFTDSNCKKSA